MSARQRDGAFTLIELLVVIGIMLALMAIVFMSTGKQQRGALVRQEAEKLAATFRQVRRQAMSTRSLHAVVFNIQNQPGSSGAVLNNRSGGHWYRVLGPSPRAVSVTWGRKNVTDKIGCIPFSTEGLDFPDFLLEVEQAWKGAPAILPPGKVRFLALGDQDEGPRLRGENNPRPNATNVRWYGQAGETTYPRPWFGYFDGTRLWPWGGYDPGKPYSGFYYQGKDGPVIGCRNQLDRLYDNNFNQEAGSVADPMVFADKDRNGDGDMTDLYEQEVQFPVWRKDGPRPLVNGAWLDACIGFFPDGSAHYFEWNRARHMYADAQTSFTANPSSTANGVRDMGKTRIDRIGSPVGSYGIDYVYSLGIEPYEDRSEPVEDIPEVAHFDRHTGGWNITLAPDAADDRVEFPSARDALDTMMPMWRVFIGRNGVVQPYQVRQDPAFTAGRTCWPPAPGDWLNTTAVVANPVWSNCRLGWLHRVDTATGNAARLIPRGKPITDVVNATMLQQRIWWIDE